MSSVGTGKYLLSGPAGWQHLRRCSQALLLNLRGQGLLLLLALRHLESVPIAAMVAKARVFAFRQAPLILLGRLCGALNGAAGIRLPNRHEARVRLGHDGSGGVGGVSTCAAGARPQAHRAGPIGSACTDAVVPWSRPGPRS